MAEQQAPRVHSRDRDGDTRGTEVRRDRGTETKASFKTTELIVYALAVLGVLIASAIVDNSFGADPAWRYDVPDGRLHDQPRAGEGRLPVPAGRLVLSDKREGAGWGRDKIPAPARVSRSRAGVGSSRREGGLR